MVEVVVTPAATDESQKSLEFSESASWSNHEKEVSGKLVASRNSDNSWYSKDGSRKTATSFSCLQQMYLTWRKSFRSDDKFLAEVQRITWMTSTSTSLYGVYSWMSHSKLQLVHLGRDFLDSQRITKNQLLKSAKQLFQMTESWSRIRQKSVVGPRLIFFEKKKKAYVEIDDSTMWQRDWDYECQNLCLRRLGAVSGKYQWPTSRSLEQQN